MRRSAFVRSLVFALVVLALGQAASASGGLSTRLYAWPGHEADWTRGVGYPDGTKANYGLRFEKTDPAADNWAGAAIGGFDNPVSRVGFTLNGDCDAGLWFYIRTSDGQTLDLTCDQAPTKTLLVAPDGTEWLRVEFALAAIQAEVIHLRYSPPLRADAAVVDDITVNDKSAGKPGKN